MYISEVPHQPQDRPHVSQSTWYTRSVRSAPLATAYRYDVIKWPQKLQSDQAHTENPEATRGKKNIRVFEQPQTKQLTERVE